MTRKQPAKSEAQEQPSLRLEWRTPQELAENPRNWRTHPASQTKALQGVMQEVGWAGALLFNEASGRLIDGHARRKLALEQGSEKVPVLVGSWTEAQERIILASLDPIAGMAETDDAMLKALIDEVSQETPEMAALLEEIAGAKAGEDAGGVDPNATGGDPGDGGYAEQYGVIVACRTEGEQREVYERLTSEGLDCKVVVT